MNAPIEPPAIGLFVDLAGWGGALLLLLAYGLIASGNWRAENRSYQLANALGSFCLLANAAWHRAWPSMFVNGVWILIAGVSLGRGVGRNLVAPKSISRCSPPADALVIERRPPPCR